MKNLCFRIFVALIGIAGFGFSAKAQDVDHMKVKIPYQFVVDGKSLPAGTYTVTRVSDADTRALILSNFEDRVSVIVLPATVESQYSQKSTISLEPVEGEFVLSQIRTQDHVFTIPVSPAPLTQLANSNSATPSASASSAGR